MPEPQHGEAVTLSDEIGQALNALGAALPDGTPQILIDEDGKEMPVLSKGDLAAALAMSPEPFISPLVGDDVAFLWRRVEADPIDWSTEVIAPTLVLEKVEDGQHVQVLFYVLDEPQPREDVEALAAFIGCDLDGSAPLPGSIGFNIAYVGETEFSLDDLDALMMDVETVSPAEGGDLGMYGDAKIMAPFSEDDPQLQREITVTVGSNSKSTHWKPTKMKLGDMIAQLAQHKVGPKDGLSWVLGEMVGGMRNIKAVKSMTAVGLDIDTGMSSEAIDAELKKLDRLSIRYTTHSNMRGTIEVPKDTIARWLEKRPGGGDMTDDATIQAFLREGKGYDDAIAKTAKFVEFDHTGKGIVAKISHAPMPKNRVIIPMLAPFNMADEGASQKDAEMKWRKIPAAVARMLGDIPLDKTGSDPNRLFFMPRHAKGAEFEIALFGGPCLDWRTLELDDVWETVAAELAQGKSKSITEGGRGLAHWSKTHATRFQLADLIRDHAPNRVRSDNAKMEIECPYDGNHSNAGDVEDRACLIVNANDGDLFVASCRHESCQDYTILDMVAGMVDGSWFEREVLDDPAYYALPDDEAQPVVVKGASAPAPDVAAVRAAIEALPPKDQTPDIKPILDLIARIDDKDDRDTLMGALKKHTGRSLIDIRKSVQERRKAGVGKAKGADQNVIVDPKDGHRTFVFRGSPDERKARVFLVDTMTAANDAAALPLFSLNRGQPTALRRHDGSVSFEAMEPKAFQAALFEHCSFAEHVEEGEMTHKAPDAGISGIVHAGLRPGELPNQPSIRRAPTIGKDGQIMDRDGWFDDVLVDLGDLPSPKVPDQPTQAQVENARDFLLNDLLGDFPFDDDDDDGARGRSKASRANAVAMILTQFVRDQFKGPSPLFAVVKPSSGVGGTLLAEVPQRLFDGFASTTTPNSKREDEMEKLMSSAAMGNENFMFFDNVREFNTDTVKRTCTSERIGGRKLGSSQMVSRPNVLLWQFTGINPVLGVEMSRRSVYININARLESNAGRTYRHADFKGWLTENRSVLVGAILTLARAWWVAGAQRSAHKLASFESWSGVIGGILEHAGIEGFLTNPREETEDREGSETKEFAVEWLSRYKLTTVEEKDAFLLFDGETGLITGYAEERRRSFGRLLDSLKGRAFNIDDRVVMFMPGEAGGWRLVEMKAVVS